MIRIGIVRRTELPAGRRMSLRRAAVLLWVLPALAAVAAATFWWMNSAPVQPVSPTTLPKPSIPVHPGPQLTLQSGSGKSPQLADAMPPGDLTKVVPKQAASVADPIPVAVASSRPSLAEMQRQVVGEWTGFYQGPRRLTVRQDGTATMTAEPEGVAAFLLAPRLIFEVQWTIQGEQLEFETISGVPADKVAVVVKMYGRKRSHRILSLQSDRLELMDEDGTTKYIWTRLSTRPGTGQSDSKNSP